MEWRTREVIGRIGLWPILQRRDQPVEIEQSGQFGIPSRAVQFVEQGIALAPSPLKA